jgi:hypothetical protein
MVLKVSILSADDDDELVVSFGLGEHAQTSLTLLRTPNFEPLLDERERGVSVGDMTERSCERALLVSVDWGDRVVKLVSTHRRWTLGPSTQKTSVRPRSFCAR